MIFTCTYWCLIKGFRMSRDGLFTYPDHSDDTRGGRCPVPAFQRLAISSNSLSTGVPKTWNDLSPNIKICTTLRGFKKALLEFLLGKYIDGGEWWCWWVMPWCNLSPRVGWVNYGWLLDLLGDSSVASGSSDPGGSMCSSYSWALRCVVKSPSTASESERPRGAWTWAVN